MGGGNIAPPAENRPFSVKKMKIFKNGLLLLLFIVKNADCKYKINGIAIYTLKTKRNHQKKTGFANNTYNDKHILKRKCLNLSKAIILPCQ